MIVAQFDVYIWCLHLQQSADTRQVTVLGFRGHLSAWFAGVGGSMLNTAMYHVSTS